MANKEHLAQIHKGVGAWNAWRKSRPKISPDLSGADLTGKALVNVNFEETDLETAILAAANMKSGNLIEANLARANLNDANLSLVAGHRANLRGADIGWANLQNSDLRHANFLRAKLPHSDLSWSHLEKANFVDSVLLAANLTETDLTRADFSGADLTRADLRGSYLSESKFCKSNLRGTTFTGAIFHNTDLTDAEIGVSIFGDNDLRGAVGLESLIHHGPSDIGIRTIYLSEGQIPESFLRGCGVPEDFLVYAKSLAGSPVQFYSCFISYSTKDQDFADRLYADLQSRGVRCWFAPHDAQAGKKLHEQIDEAIRLHDKLLLILSSHSINSEWVKTEISKARKREVRDRRRVLFPIALVPFETLRDWECFDADTGKDSAREIREFFIPDFSNWKNHDTYSEALQKLFRDLKSQ